MAGKTLLELRQLPKKDLEKINKVDIIDSILAASDNDVGVLGRLETRLNAISDELASLRQLYTQAEQANSKKIDEMQKKLEKQAEILLSQQLFLENVDRKERETHLVLLGVPEDQEALEGATNDADNLGNIFYYWCS